MMTLWRCGFRSTTQLLNATQRRSESILASSVVPQIITSEPANLESEVFLRRVLNVGGDKKDFLHFLRLVAYEGHFTSGLANEVTKGQEWLLGHLKDVDHPAHVLGFLGGLSANAFPFAELNEEVAKAFFDKAADVLPQLDKNAASFRLLAMVAPAVHKLRYYHEPFLRAMHEWSLDAAYNYHFPQSFNDGAIVADSFAMAGYPAYDLVSYLVEECMRVAVGVHDKSVSLDTVTGCMWAAISHGLLLDHAMWDYLATKRTASFVTTARFDLDLLDKMEVVFDKLPFAYQRELANHLQNLKEIRTNIRLDLEYVHNRVVSVFPTILPFDEIVGERPLAAYLDSSTKMPQPWGSRDDTKLVALLLPRQSRTLRPAGLYDGMVKYRADLLGKKGVRVAVLPLEELRGLSSIETSCRVLKAMQSVM